MKTTFLELKKYFLFLILLSVTLSLYTAHFAHMNNWLIFKASFFHLLEGTSLYQLYPHEYNDLYKYSPSFALFMAPLSLLPAWLGAILWNLIGASLFILAICKLPISHSTRKGIFWISLPEFIGSTQGFQSNIHLVALLVLFWVYLENKQVFLANTNLLTSAFIKIFGILAACLFIFHEYSTKNLKFFLKNIFVGLALFIFFSFFPAIIIGWDSLIFQYKEWLILLKNDASISYGFSLMGFIHGISGLEFNYLPIQIAGGLSLLLSFFFFRKGDQNSRLMALIALCYFLIVFNHKSESPTFIIAMMAFGIHQGLIANQRLRWSLIVFTMGCVSLMYSDIFRSIKQSHLDVYCVKVWPFLILYPLAITQGFIKKSVKQHSELHS